MCLCHSVRARSPERVGHMEFAGAIERRIEDLRGSRARRRVDATASRLPLRVPVRRSYVVGPWEARATAHCRYRRENSSCGTQGLANITGQQCADRHHATRLLLHARGATAYRAQHRRDLGAIRTQQNPKRKRKREGERENEKGSAKFARAPLVGGNSPGESKTSKTSKTKTEKNSSELNLSGENIRQSRSVSHRIVLLSSSWCVRTSRWCRGGKKKGTIAI